MLQHSHEVLTVTGVWAVMVLRIDYRRLDCLNDQRWRCHQTTWYSEISLLQVINAGFDHRNNQFKTKGFRSKTSSIAMIVYVEEIDHAAVSADALHGSPSIVSDVWKWWSRACCRDILVRMLAKGSKFGKKYVCYTCIVSSRLSTFSAW